ncbi:MAG: UDP-N-acetylmuramate--L-alanine ligase [Bacteroidales bacterium]
MKKNYFLGIGGIGMSALAKYYIAKGEYVAGYDMRESDITKELQELGAEINFVDSHLKIPQTIVESLGSRVIYTPAIPHNSNQLKWFRERGYTTIKRADALKVIMEQKRVIAVAGSHGKSSITTMVAHLFTHSKMGCTAFLGGISLNYRSNLVESGGEVMVVEADEFDRSFHKLWPEIAVITSTEPDHLDIYHNASGVVEAYREFAQQVSDRGSLIIKKGYEKGVTEAIGAKVYSYSCEEQADFYADSITPTGRGLFTFTLHYPTGEIEGCSVGVPGRVNIENGVAAFAAAYLYGMDPQEGAKGLSSFKGVRRRFETLYRSEEKIYIDDYAHHPKEVACSIESIRDIAPQKSLTVIFQPHLYSRTRDFMQQFGISLSKADRVILLDIYPAREEPIEGISSESLFREISIDDKYLSTMESVVELIEKLDIEVVATLGAGDIEKLREPIVQMLRESNG